MKIYPAIDLKNGKCVRLYQGKYSMETIYSDDAFNMLNNFISQGADWIHLVDLDGANDLNQNQSELIYQLIQANSVNFQIGGGIRAQSQIQSLLDKGAARVILGSLAVTKPNTVYEWMRYFGPERIMLALDVSMNKNNIPVVAIEAWKNITTTSLYNMIEFYLSAGLRHLLCTNIAFDGTLQGPDYDLYENILNKFPDLYLQASGGIRSIADVQELKKRKIAGCVIGRALYENRFTLSEALSC